jgi:hypothetical protein
MDKKGREQKFVRGHSSRFNFVEKYTATCRRCGEEFDVTKRGQWYYCSEGCRFPPVLCGCGCGGRISNKSLGKNPLTRYLPGHHWIGRKHTQEELDKIGAAVSGSKNGRWNGGTANLPYTYEFIKYIRKQIREEYKNRCALCSRECQGKHGWHVHHIDYNRDNNEKENLILLCSRCHGRTHVNRKEWRAILERIRKEVLHDHSSHLESGQ